MWMPKKKVTILRVHLNDVIQSSIAFGDSAYSWRKPDMQRNTDRRYDEVWNLENELWIEIVHFKRNKRNRWSLEGRKQ